MSLAVNRISTFARGGNYTIFSDSRSALQSLLDRSTRNPLVCAIQQSLCLLPAQNHYIEFCWVPSHVSVPGNEWADEEAKQAATHGVSCSQDLPPAVRLGYFPATYF